MGGGGGWGRGLGMAEQEKYLKTKTTHQKHNGRTLNNLDTQVLKQICTGHNNIGCTCRKRSRHIENSGHTRKQQENKDSRESKINLINPECTEQNDFGKPAKPEGKQT